MAKMIRLNIAIEVLVVALLGLTSQTGVAEGPADGRPIDSHRQNGADGADAANAGRFGAQGRTRAHRLSVLGAPQGVERNAIGVPVAQAQGVSTGARTHIFPMQTSSPFAGLAPVGVRGIDSSVGGGLYRSNIGRPRFNPVVTATGANQGQINGTDLTHPDTAPSRLGGPAKAITGINGSALRPRR
jgi:hypothetical protein